MPWSEKSIMSQRHEFVMLFEQEGVNRRELCRRFGVSPTIGYRLWARWRAEGKAGLADRSRRPQHSPGRSAAAVEGLVLAVRDAHPAWGGRKIRRRLQDLKHQAVPSASTITAILHRHGCIAAAAGTGHKAFERFERAAPNELWQMDYKGHFATRAGRCHPLTVVDDHSRYAIGLRACGDEREGTVQRELTAIFRRYGLPERMLMDNGSPWGSSDAEHRHTWLSLWLLELGVAVSHGRPYHPQTQGKDERFHRTLMAELIGRRAFADLAECQSRFDAWRVVYNTQRPHEALDLATPAARYRPSPRPFPEKIEPFDYGPGAIVRRVDAGGWLSFRNRPIKLGKAFSHRAVALRPTDRDGCFEVLFWTHKLGAVDLREAAP
ncbi:MAG TPA: IS481 family transposase [Stellaceae bacterium]|nr:IS481 family transposase [Stellaceae bacterium]